MHNFIQQFWPSTVDGLTLGSIYALIALGYTLVYGVLRLINFAHSEVFMIGTFGSLFMLHALDVNSPKTGFVLVGVLLLSLLAAMAASGVTAVLLERIAYRPLRRRGAGRLAALISAIGASFFLQEVFALRYGRDLIAFPRVMKKTTLFKIGAGDVRNDKLLVFVAAVVVMVILERFVNGTRLGRGIRATAQDPETAVLMGVNIDRVVFATFLLGGLMAGVAAMLFTLRFENTQYIIGFLPGIKAFTAAVLGGIGNLRGALIGGLVLGLVESYGGSIFGSQWIDVVAFSVLVIVLMFRPTGILGESLARARA
ncbi:MAG: branched-chain amino acid transport system permease protein [Actinomycetota bacterium]|nr:branched-chain amino acid transport system permease protein [Actinomycetota bacterium]